MKKIGKSLEFGFREIDLSCWGAELINTDSNHPFLLRSDAINNSPRLWEGNIITDLYVHSLNLT